MAPVAGWAMVGRPPSGVRMRPSGQVWVVVSMSIVTRLQYGITTVHYPAIGGQEKRHGTV